MVEGTLDSLALGRRILPASFWRPLKGQRPGLESR